MGHVAVVASQLIAKCARCNDYEHGYSFVGLPCIVFNPFIIFHILSTWEMYIYVWSSALNLQVSVFQLFEIFVCLISECLIVIRNPFFLFFNICENQYVFSVYQKKIQILSTCVLIRPETFLAVLQCVISI